MVVCIRAHGPRAETKTSAQKCCRHRSNQGVRGDRNQWWFNPSVDTSHMHTGAVVFSFDRMCLIAAAEHTPRQPHQVWIGALTSSAQIYCRIICYTKHVRNLPPPPTHPARGNRRGFIQAAFTTTSETPPDTIR